MNTLSSTDKINPLSSDNIAASLLIMGFKYKENGWFVNHNESIQVIVTNNYRREYDYIVYSKYKTKTGNKRKCSTRTDLLSNLNEIIDKLCNEDRTKL